MLLLPLFLLFAFGLLQLGQLGTALLVVNYAASTVARQMVQENRPTSNMEDKSRFDKLLVAGMQNDILVADPIQNANSSNSGGLKLENLTVHACAEVTAFPTIGPILGQVLSDGLGSGSCENLQSFAFSTSPYRFIIHGKATLRMNYQS